MLYLLGYVFKSLQRISKVEANWDGEGAFVIFEVIFQQILTTIKNTKDTFCYYHSGTLNKDCKTLNWGERIKDENMKRANFFFLLRVSGWSTLNQLEIFRTAAAARYLF